MSLKFRDEIWKPVKGYGGYYEVSNYGRVRSIDRVVNNHFYKGRILSQRTNKYGYVSVHLSIEGVDEKLLVHRLVAIAFLPNPHNLPQVNHKDEDKSNNCVWNLEWCSVKYNSNYGTHPEKLRIASTGRKMPISAVKKIAEANKKPVGKFLNGVLVKQYASAADASREDNNLSYVSISAACNGRLQTYRGFEWRFI